MNIKQTLTDAVHEVSSLKSDLKEVAEIRRELLKIEVEECSSYLKKKIVLLVLLICSGFFFLCLTLVTLIGWIGALMKPFLPDSLQPFSWQLVTLAICLGFMIVGLTCLLKLKKKPSHRFFQSSLQEIKNDSAWLKTLTNKEKNS